MTEKAERWASYPSDRSSQGQKVTGDNFNTRADTRTPGADMVRIHWKVKDSQFDFMSARMTREAAQVKAAEMRNDPELYGVEIRED